MAVKGTTPLGLGPMMLGTSSFTASGWEGAFYPKGMKQAEYLAFYAEQFRTVEIDATFYGCPSERTVAQWNARTPEGFVFSVKLPQMITHEKVLRDCDAELSEFLTTMEGLGPKLGPMIFQFPYFSRAVFRDRHEFLDRLVPFLKKLPENHKFAVEVRNREWIDAELASLLRDHGMALVLQDRSWMNDPAEWKFDPITAAWTYIRWLGDRKWIGEVTQRWDKVVVDRAEELGSWVDFCYQIRKRGITVYAYANNHFQGHGPATIAKFIELWNKKGFPDIDKGPKPQPRERTLFE